MSQWVQHFMKKMATEPFEVWKFFARTDRTQCLSERFGVGRSLNIIFQKSNFWQSVAVYMQNLSLSKKFLFSRFKNRLLPCRWIFKLKSVLNHNSPVLFFNFSEKSRLVLRLKVDFDTLCPKIYTIFWKLDIPITRFVCMMCLNMFN